MNAIHDGRHVGHDDGDGYCLLQEQSWITFGRHPPRIFFVARGTGVEKVGRGCRQAIHMPLHRLLDPHKEVCDLSVVFPFWEH